MTLQPGQTAFDVIVVGAGIAGLTAARRLQQSGSRVVVLEAHDHVGGRMTSGLLNGQVVDRGAQFLSSGYTIIPRLLEELGLADRMRPTSRLCAIVRGGRPRVLRVDRPVDAWSSGLLSLGAFLRLGWHTWRAGRAAKLLSLSDYSDWDRFDDETTRSWSERHCGREVCDYFLELLLQGFYFQSPKEASRALALAVTTFGLRQATTTTLQGGLGQLPEALAQGLDVRLNTSVNGVREVDGHVRVGLASGYLEAPHVVLAVPAPAACKLVDVSDLGPVARELLSTTYSSSILVAVQTDAQFKLPDALADVYGLLIPEPEREHVAAVGIEVNKLHDDGSASQLLNLMFCHQSATRNMQLPDNALVAHAIGSIEPLIPGLSKHVVQSLVIRWPYAEPIAWVGRAKAIRRYRKLQSTNPTRIVLSGDYMSMPYTEGAAESGGWAAKTVACSGPRRN